MTRFHPGDLVKIAPTSKSKYKEIPIYNVRMMSDEEWNRLAYKNYLQRKQQETKNEK